MTALSNEEYKWTMASYEKLEMKSVWFKKLVELGKNQELLQHRLKELEQKMESLYQKQTGGKDSKDDNE